METKNRRPLLAEWIDYDPNRDTPRLRGHCPIANAIKDNNPNLRWVFVSRETIRFMHRDSRLTQVFSTPNPAKDFLDQLDRGEWPEGFWLILREADLLYEFHSPRFKRVVIEPDGRGAGPRGPYLRPVAAEVA